MENAAHTITASFTEKEAGVIRALAYSSIFSYPLSKKEIIEKFPFEIDDNDAILKDLDSLCQRGIIRKQDDLYFLSTSDSGVSLRQERNRRALKYRKLAQSISRFIGNFPYVRAVFLSGSISKDSMDKDSDIDYFIITEPGKLWICRTLLIAFKKIFLLNSYKFFCLNYFVDSKNLVIKDHNFYTALEVRTLIPTYGRRYCADFFQSNEWTSEYLPNLEITELKNVPESRKKGLKWLMEGLFNMPFGEKMENHFRDVFQNHWKRKFRHLDEQTLREINISSKSMSAHHPENFKKIVLQRYEAILRELGQRHNFSFT